MLPLTDFNCQNMCKFIYKLSEHATTQLSRRLCGFTDGCDKHGSCQVCIAEQANQSKVPVWLDGINIHWEHVTFGF